MPEDLSPDEIAEALLDEAGTLDVLPTSESNLLEYLGLKQMSFDFGAEPDFIGAAPEISSKLRAALSVNHRVVATHSKLGAKRSRWGVFHEIAHFILPEHVEKLFLDDDKTLSVWTHNRLEREANSLAAELVFQGNRFTQESADFPLSFPQPDKEAGSYAATREMELLRAFGFKLTFAAENLAYMGNYTEDLQRSGVECVHAPFIWSDRPAHRSPRSGIRRRLHHALFDRGKIH